MNKILDEINEENRKHFGIICGDCSLFEHFCRCNPTTLYVNIKPIPEGDVSEYIKRITAYFKKPVNFTEDEQIN
jgi:hypothetical protein